jgi:hypothetical protein
VSPGTRVLTVVSTPAQTKAPKRLRPGQQTPWGGGIAGDGPPAMLVDARFISFIPVELLLTAFRAGIMPQRGASLDCRGAERA